MMDEIEESIEQWFDGGEFEEDVSKALSKEGHISISSWSGYS